MSETVLMPDQTVLFKAYRAVFTGEQGKAVLNDLADFCWMFSCTAGMATELYEGRRTVFLHILEKMGLGNTYNVVAALQNVPPEILVEKQEIADGTSKED